MRRTRIVSISVTDELYGVMLERSRAGMHSSISEYVRSLVRLDREDSTHREGGNERLSPEPTPVNELLAAARWPAEDADLPDNDW
ncbi:MAG: hypothetical protein AB7F88_16485 [Pyrinomonadaceae bacterium]